MCSHYEMPSLKEIKTYLKTDLELPLVVSKTLKTNLNLLLKGARQAKLPETMKCKNSIYRLIKIMSATQIPNFHIHGVGSHI